MTAVSFIREKPDAHRARIQVEEIPHGFSAQVRYSVGKTPENVREDSPMNTRFAIGGLLALVMQIQPVDGQLVQVRHWSGQGVAPVYEGYDINPDGSYNMWFGYMNRNYEEEIDIPIGPGNHFEPGNDRGQPTHFTVRRHKDVFKVVVPKDFGDQKLTWTLTVHGQTAQVTGTLKPVWMIDRLRTTRGGNS